MIEAELIIRCWLCGKEETIKEVFEDSVIDFNLDKLCPNCNGGWMIKKELTIKKSGLIQTLPVMRY